MSYTSNDIQVLEGIEHVRTNPSMYIGDTTQPTHLAEEALDNALDECLAGYATIAAIDINTKEHTCSILDNGRGIPIDSDVPITISTKLFSGGKFKNKKSAYNISAGLHGIGLVAINALSTNYSLEIYRDNTHALFTFKDCILVDQIIEEYTDKTPFSTKLTFSPDKQYFDSLDFDIDKLRSRLQIASAELSNKNCKFILSIDDKPEYFSMDQNAYFDKYCLSEGSDIISRFDISIQNGNEKFYVICAYENASTTQKVISSINLLPVSNGGIHVDTFYDAVKNYFIAKAKKDKLRFVASDVLSGIRCYFSLNLEQPKFSGQTKYKLSNNKSEFLNWAARLNKEVYRYFEAHPEEVNELLEMFARYRAKADNKKVRGVTMSRRGSTKFTKLRDCTSDNGELYIVEGDSAAGSLIQCRNNKLHAVLPLKGKIPNITSAKDIMSNVEIKELITSFGTGFGPEFDLGKLKYDKIICATDADSDGNHISVLMMMVLSILTPDIIKTGHFYLARTPLYAINEGKTFIPLWDEESRIEAQNSNRNITRFKGLGELNPWQLKICLLDEDKRKLIRVEYNEDSIPSLLKLMESAAEKKKLLDDMSIDANMF